MATERPRSKIGRPVRVSGEKHTREKIFDAALDLFAARGYDGTSMRQIADAVGLTESAVYRHYAGKKAILDAIFTFAEGRIYSPLPAEAMRAGPEGRSIFWSLLIPALDVMLAEPAIVKIVRIIYAEMHHNPEIRRYFQQEYVKRADEVIEAIFREQMARGTIRACDPRALAHVFNAFRSEWAFQTFIVEHDEPLDVEAAKAALAGPIRFFEDLLLTDSRPRIDINDGARSVPADPGTPILFALMAEGVFLPSACGGRASCGQCRVRVLDGVDAHNAEEIALLPGEERARGIHLACQARVTRAVRIAVPPSSLGARQLLTRVVGMRDPAPGMREIDLELDGAAVMTFVAGQYVQLIVPGTEHDVRPLYRAYSVTSSPRQGRTLSLLVGRVKGGACSSYVFEHLRVGDAVTINGPFGDFHLRDGSGPALLVAGGTGIAPMRSILIDAEERGIARPITLFFVARTRADLVWLDELSGFPERIPGFRFVPILSHPRPEDAWTGEKGGMASVLSRMVARADDAEAYLCGAPGMIDSSIAALRAGGIAPDRVFFDKFS